MGCPMAINGNRLWDTYYTRIVLKIQKKQKHLQDLLVGVFVLKVIN